MLDAWIETIESIKTMLPKEAPDKLHPTLLKKIQEVLKANERLSSVIPYLSDEALSELIQSIFSPKLYAKSEILKQFDPHILETYNALLPLIYLACLVQGNADYEKSQYDVICAKLACFFHSTDDGIQYLKNFQRSHDSSKRLFDATNFKLPESPGWTMSVWQALAKRHLDKDVFKKILPYIVNIEFFHAQLYRDEPTPQLEAYIQYSLDKKARRLYQKEQRYAEKAFEQLLSTMLNLGISNTDEDSEARYISLMCDRAKTKRIEHAKTLEENIHRLGEKHPSVVQQAKHLAYPLDIDKVNSKAQQTFASYRMGKEAFVQARLDKVKASFVSQSKSMVKQLKRELMESPKLEEYSLATLTRLAHIAGYRRSSEHILAADLLIDLVVPEENFNTYLDIIHSQVKTKDDALLPAPVLDARTIQLGDFFVMKLSKDDPRGAFLGYPTGCCQNIGSLAEAFALFGSLEKNACFYIIVRGHPPYDLNESTTSSIQSSDIVAMTLAWRNPGSSTLVFDTFENSSYKISEEMCRMLFYQYGERLMQVDSTIQRIVIDYDINKATGYSKNENIEVIQFTSKKQYEFVMRPRKQMIFMEKSKPQLAQAYHHPDLFLTRYENALHQLQFNLFSETATHYLGCVSHTIRPTGVTHSNHTKHYLSNVLPRMLAFALRHTEIDLLSDPHRVFFKILDKALTYELTSILAILLHPPKHHAFNFLTNQVGFDRQPVIFRGLTSTDPSILESMLASSQCHSVLLEHATFNLQSIVSFALILKNHDALALILKSDKCSKALLERIVSLPETLSVMGDHVSQTTALHLACYLDDDKGVELILTCPSFRKYMLYPDDVKHIDSVLSLAIKLRRVTILTRLLSSPHYTQSMLNLPNRGGLTPMQQAVTENAPQVVTCLLESGLCSPEQIRDICSFMQLRPEKYTSLLSLFESYYLPGSVQVSTQSKYGFFPKGRPEGDSKAVSADEELSQKIPHKNTRDY